MLDSSPQFASIPYSATSAVSYFNSLYDGWVSEWGDCDGNVYSSGYTGALIYEGDMHNNDESFSSIYGGKCLVADVAQTPFSGSIETITTAVSNFRNIVDTWYADCDDCETTSSSYGIYYFSANTNCTGGTITSVTFTADTLSNGSPFGGSYVTPVLKINGECIGSESYPYNQTTGTTPNSVVTANYSACTDCNDNINQIQTHYYFSACTGGNVYRAVKIDFDDELGLVTLGATYLLEDISDLPNDCYTVINSTTPYTSFVGYGPTSSITTVSNCNDAACLAVVTPTPTDRDWETIIR